MTSTITKPSPSHIDNIDKCHPNNKTEPMALSDLPDEIVTFLENSGQTMLIKGSAGVGKTTLALGLLATIPGKKIYMSTRVTPEDLYIHIPWTKDFLNEKNIINACVPYKRKKQIDALLVSDMYLALPENLKLLIDMVKKEENTTIVIDSWDSIVDWFRLSKSHDVNNFPREDGLESLLLDQLRLKKTNLILVAEHSEKSKLDYLVDGIIQLSTTLEDDRMFRQLELVKLRGTCIKQPRYLYTLDSCKFKTLRPPNTDQAEVIIKTPQTEIISKHRSSGIEILDALNSGGFKKGSFNLFEIEAGVPDEVMWLLIPGIAKALRENKPVVVVLPDGSSEKQFLKQTLSLIEESQLDKLNIISVDELEQKPEKKPVLKADIGGINEKEEGENDEHEAKLKEFLNYKVFLERDITFADFCSIWERAIRKSRGEGENIWGVLSLDGLEYRWGAEVVKKKLGRIVSVLKSSGDTIFSIVKQGQELVPTVTSMATTHWCLTTKNGSLILYGKNPNTAIYSIVFDRVTRSDGEKCYQMLLVHLR